MGSSKSLHLVALGSPQVGVYTVQLGQAWPNQEVVEC